MTHQQAVQRLKAKQGMRSLRSYAKEIGISPAYLSDIYRGRRELGPTLLSFLKLTKKLSRAAQFYYVNEETQGK